MKKIVTLIFLFMFLTACSSTVTQLTEEPTSVPIEAYPAPREVTSTLPAGYPPPEDNSNDASQSPPSPTQTIDSSLAQVKGTFKLAQSPYSTYVLYLAPIVRDADGKEIVVNFNRDLSIAAVPDQNGDFHFVNVPPGSYGLVYDAIVTSYLMTEPGKPQSLVVRVEGNEVVDLGVLQYEAPPNN